VIVEFEATPDDYYRASRELNRTSRLARVDDALAWVPPVAVFAMGALFLVLRAWPTALAFMAGALAWTGYILAVPLLQKRAIARNLESNPSAAGPVRYELDEAGVNVTYGGSSTYIPWSNITRVDVTNRFVLLMTSRAAGQFIARSALTDAQVDQIVAWGRR